MRTLPSVIAQCSVLAVIWVLLSGHYTPLLLGLGTLSVALVAWLAARMGVTPGVGALRRLPRVAAYAPWLLVQIARSALDVARRVLQPGLPISPRIVEVRASQRSDAWRVVFANSITLTPGTVTVELSGERLRVHALTRPGADALVAGDMDRRVAAVSED